MQTEKPTKTLFLHEIFEDISKSETQKEAADKLKNYSKTLPRYQVLVMNDVLLGALDRTFVWALPTGTPPFKPNDESGWGAPSNVFKELPKRIKLFLDGPKRVENRNKREKLFIQMLESIHPKDAKIVVDMISKKIDYKHLTPTVVRLAYGDNFFREDKQKAKEAA